MSDVAYELREGATATAGPISFPGVPGVWLVGEPVTAHDLGMTEEQMDDLVENGNLPLDKTTGESTRADGQMVSGADVPHTIPEDPRAVEAAAALAEDKEATLADLKAQADALGIDTSRMRTKQQVADAITAHTQTADDTPPPAGAPTEEASE